MAKGPKNHRKYSSKPAKPPTRTKPFAEDDIDDDVDAFHKQRDVVPLDVNADEGDSDEDAEHPVLNFEEEEDDEDDDDDEEEDDIQDKGFAAKIARQAKYLEQKFGRVDDEMNDDDGEQEEERKAVWGRKKDVYHGADNVDYELQSSDEDPIAEEAEASKIVRDKAKYLTMADFGLEDADQVENDADGRKKVFQDTFAGKKTVEKHGANSELEDGCFDNYEEIKKDLNALSKEEQMEVVYSSAPELVGLLSELNEALNQLKQMKPFLPQVVKDRKDITKGGLNHLEVKHITLLAYCQAIGFYLLLKSEGHPVQDHPVIARLVEIKNLLEKMKQIDTNVPPHIEDTVNHKFDARSKLVRESVPHDFEADKIDASAEPLEKTCVNETTHLIKDNCSKDLVSKTTTEKQHVVGFKSMEMLKVRANLEAKLKQKGIYNLTNPKPERSQNIPLKRVNQRLETLDDYNDEVQPTSKGNCTKNVYTGLLQLSKPSQLVANKVKKAKFVSGDDDLPKRDDIGERRRKFELRVLSRAGTKSEGDDVEDDDMGDEDVCDKETLGDVDGQERESEDEFYKQVKQQREGKLLAKARLYSRAPVLPTPSLETEADGKRQISYQMEKNRGLTRPRKKLLKNPRKKYKIKHQKALIRRKGQVRDIRKSAGPYGGEASGVNINVSRSIRFKN